MAKIVLGVTGGIAAFKSVEVLRALQRSGHEVRVVMTPAATRFVGPATFAALSGQEVGIRMFAREERPGYHHVDLMAETDVLAIVPATANTIAGLAHGRADDLLTSCHLAFRGPVIVAPAMNTKMYEHPATVSNLEVLRQHGVAIVDPEVGLLADGEVGAGRLASQDRIVAAIERAAGPGDLSGRRVLITAGGTREPIDSVRYVGNRSSGKTGLALAEVAHRRGAERVTLVSANIAMATPVGVERREAATAAQMREATLDALGAHDVLIMAAAVADYRPVTTTEGKIDKSGSDAMTLELERTDDVLIEAVRRHGPAQVIVGFAAEHGAAGLARAREKRERKEVDLIVHNDIGAAGIGFGADENAITIIGPGSKETAVARADKHECAERILDAVVDALGA